MHFRAIRSILGNRELIWEMALRDLKGRNKGAFLGYMWLVISPLIQVAAFVVIVSLVFKIRLHPGAGSFDYALYVLSGMIPWQIITKSLQESTSLIRERIDWAKQVIYPIETLPLTELLVSSLGSMVTLSIFAILALVTGHFRWTYFLFPLALLPLLMLVLGVSWIFSIVGVIIKDLREVVTIALGLLVYLSPVLMSESMVGKRIWGYILWNPLTHPIICFRDVFSSNFHIWSWIIFLSMALVAFKLGWWVVTRTKLLINEYI